MPINQLTSFEHFGARLRTVLTCFSCLVSGFSSGLGSGLNNPIRSYGHPRFDCLNLQVYIVKWANPVHRNGVIRCSFNVVQEKV